MNERMNSTHAKKLLKMLETFEALGFENVGVWLSESIGREKLYIKLNINMDLSESKPEVKKQ